jgi:peptidoglycan/LPS O-acetylase OafA/YrhL
MQSTRQSPQRLGRRPALDGLRALAVTLVIGLHVGLLGAGYVGVDVFLPLSGFLITVLVYEEWERNGGISLRRFYARRVRRLLPALVLLLAAYVLVMIVLDPFHGQWSTGRLLATTLLFVNNWVTTLAPGHGAVLGPLSPTWTLAQEGQFYLLWPPVLLGLLRLRRHPRTVLALLAVAIVAVLIADPLAERVYAGYNAYTSPLDRSAELLFGCAAAIVWRERFVPHPLRSRVTGWTLLAGLVFIVATGKPSVPAWYLTAGVLSALLIINLLSVRGPERAQSPGGPPRSAAPSLLGLLLAWRPLAYTGRISYGIYLFHVPIYYLIWTYAPIQPTYLYWPVVFAGSCAVAALSWTLVESPILRRSRPRGGPRHRSVPHPRSPPAGDARPVTHAVPATAFAGTRSPVGSPAGPSGLVWRLRDFQSIEHAEDEGLLRGCLRTAKAVPVGCSKLKRIVSVSFVNES